MKMLLFAFITFSSLFSHCCDAATFAYRALSNGNYVIDMTGEITSGDHIRLLSIIKSEPAKFLGTTTISLHSPGGSVQEAISISELLRQSGISIGVESDQTCASSCFLIWVAADFRLSFVSSHIVIHRPYFSAESITVGNFKEKSMATGKALVAMREFLTEQNVSSALIDRMMQLPSTEGYELSLADRLQLGALSPLLEEKAIKNCGVSNSTFLKSPNVKEAAWCVGDILKELRLPYLISTIGFDSAIRASSARASEAAVREGKAALAAGEDLPPVQHEAMMYFGCAVTAVKASSKSYATDSEAADAALQSCKKYYDALVMAWALGLNTTTGPSPQSTELARAGADGVKATIRKRLLELGH